MRTVVLWGLVGMYALSALVQILQIGEERKPRTSGEAALGVILSAAMIAAVLYVAS